MSTNSDNPLSRRLRLWFRTASLAGICSLGVLPPTSMATGENYETRVMRTVDAIVESDLSASLEGLEALVRQYPNSKLGHLLLGDLLAARAGTPDLISRFSGDRHQLDGLRDELASRWMQVNGQTPAARGMIPDDLILSSPEERYILVADASHARLYVYENTGTDYRLAADFYMTIGREGMVKNVEGDLRTPEGVYFVTAYLPGEGLPPRYGPGAFPIDYPNEYDRQLKRTGYGIWIHGTEPDFINKVPLASDGCLSLSNTEFNRIRRYISTDSTTPVIISRTFNWIDPATLNSRKSSALELLGQWERDWESLDTEQYLAHYSRTDLRNYDEFADQKRQTNRNKEYVELELSDLSIYGYPGDEKMLLVSFTQDYRSDNYHSVMRKRQYWVNRDDHWQIINESRTDGP